MYTREWQLTCQEVADVIAKGGDVQKAQEAKKKAWLEANPPKGEMILLTVEETEQAFNAEWRVDFREPLPSSAARHGIAKAQLKKVVDLLRQKTIKAWGGNRIILIEDWKAILKEVE